jgi:hypothetical protein
MKLKIATLLAAAILLGGLAAVRFLHVREQNKFNEIVAYFSFTESPEKYNLIRLKITARAPEPELKRSIEQHREELRAILVRAVVPGPGRQIEVRNSRRAILKVLGLENKAKAVAFDVVPDLSAMPHNKEIQELLDKAHSVSDGALPTGDL